MDHTYQLMPALSAEEYAALKEDIRQHGVLVPVEQDDQGHTLDGHHREQIVQELRLEGIDVHLPVVIRTGLTETQKRAHVRALNLHRRHLDRATRRGLIEDQLKETPDHSDRQIANGLGCDHKTVGAVRQELEATGEIPQLEKNTGADGKKRPRSGKAAEALKPGKRAKRRAETFYRLKKPVQKLIKDSPVAYRETQMVELLKNHTSLHEPIARKLADGQARTVKEAKDLLLEEAARTVTNGATYGMATTLLPLDALKEAWGKASDQEKAAFLDWVKEPAGGIDARAESVDTAGVRTGASNADQKPGQQQPGLFD